MNRAFISPQRIAASALAIASAAAISFAGAAAAQAVEPHALTGSATQLQTDGYGIGGVAVSGHIDIQKPGH